MLLAVRQEYSCSHLPRDRWLVRNTLIYTCQDAGGSSGLLSLPPIKVQVAHQDYSHFHLPRCRWIVRTTLTSTFQAAGGSTGLRSSHLPRIRSLVRNTLISTCQGAGGSPGLLVVVLRDTGYEALLSTTLSILKSQRPTAHMNWVMFAAPHIRWVVFAAGHIRRAVFATAHKGWVVLPQPTLDWWSCRIPH